MPSESNYDDLPSYQRVRLRQIAAAVIRSMPRTRRQTEAVRQAEDRRRAVIAGLWQEHQRRAARADRTELHREHRDVPAEPRTTGEPAARPALPRSPHRSFDEVGLSAELLRKDLRRERRSERSPSIHRRGKENRMHGAKTESQTHRRQVGAGREGSS